MTTSFIELDEAYRLLGSNQVVVTGMAPAEPQLFFSGLHEVGQRLEGVRIYCANPSREYPCFGLRDLESCIDFLPMFLTPALTNVQGANVHYVPQHLSQWVRHIQREEVDVFWGVCSPVDERGFVSLGTNACYEADMVRLAGVTVLEVNPRMPMTYGATTVHVSEIDHFLKGDRSLPSLNPAVPDATDAKIGAIIAGMVENGSTLQLGIGGIPNAVAMSLKDHRHLGVHTEMLNNALMELYLAGVVDGTRKTLWPRKMVASFVYGDQRLYDFVDRNPAVELHPASVVNDRQRLGKNQKMVSINTAVEIDITGQVCSESIGHRELSGVGGATDTHCGAQLAEGGQGIIALTSLTKRGNHSKIVSELKPGAKVSISRNDVDTVVTEYGIARLAGRSVAERARALIGIAHPSVREGLLRDAKEFRYI